VERVHQGLTILAAQKRGVERTLRPVADYSMPNVAEKVARIILSYTDYVNRTGTDYRHNAQLGAGSL
jgi:UDP-N-acetylglucosamine 2-epimerase (non-hydrolysing)